MISDKSTSSTPVIKQQKQTNNILGKSKLSQTNNAKKQQPQSKKKSIISKPQLVNGASNQCKLSSSRTNGNLSDSYANLATKEERKESAKSDSVAISSKAMKDISTKYTSTRVTVPIQPKLPPPTLSPQRPLPKVDSFWSITIREHDVSYRWTDDFEQEDTIAGYKEARRERYVRALQAQKEELGIGENRRKYFYEPIS